MLLTASARLVTTGLAMDSPLRRRTERLEKRMVMSW